MFTHLEMVQIKNMQIIVVPVEGYIQKIFNAISLFSVTLWIINCKNP